MKKASMQLGINAIVVLIIALAILGLAMSFITNLFKGGESKLGGLIDRTDLPVHADSVNPLVFDFSDITVKAGRSAKLVVSVYNSDFGEDSVGLALVSCVDSAGTQLTLTSTDPDMTLASPSQVISRGTDGGYRAILGVNSAVLRGTYICSIAAGPVDTQGLVKLEEAVSQQLFVNVVV
ncbi:hypothetical protein AYK26_05760 [Euryarchaeota archaeon SM23-78]|nr:MAG: hypothetical protein AYK26_05760 [Euryarchaeota archaeon SM23-78]MBW3000985.1 hypothetical protein [Candidatus Woesearchaeota archaeon]